MGLGLAPNLLNRAKIESILARTDLISRRGFKPSVVLAGHLIGDTDEPA